MAITEATVTGPVQLPSGETPVRGYIRFELTDWDKEDGEVIVSGPVDVAINVSTQTFSQTLWASSEGDRGVNYEVSAIWHYETTAKTITQSLGYASISGSGTFQLADILAASPITPTPVSVLIEATEAKEAAEAAAAAAGDSATDSAASATASASSATDAGVDAVSAAASAAAAASIVGAYSNFADITANLVSYGNGVVVTTKQEGFIYVEDDTSTFTINGIGVVPQPVKGEYLFASFGPNADGATSDTALLTRAIELADGTPIRLDGRFRVELDIADDPVNLVGEYTFVQYIGETPLKVYRTAGDDLTVTNMSYIAFDAGTLSSGATFATGVKCGLTSLDVGDVVMVTSDDILPSSVAVWGAGATVYKAILTKIVSFGLAYDAGVSSAPFQYRDTVVGMTSGATALVTSTGEGAEGDIFFTNIDGTFQNDEDLTVTFRDGLPLLNAGVLATARGKAYFVASDTFNPDDYATNPVVSKMPNVGFSVEGLTVEIEPTLNIDDFLDSAFRVPAIDISGVYRPKIRATAKSALSRFIRARSVWVPDFDINVERLPNDAETTASGYGYGVDFASASAGGQINVIATQCRHAFTTNTTSGSLKWNRGAPRGCLVTGTAQGCYAAGFDTHPMSEFITFEGCVEIGGHGLNRNFSQSASYQDRGFGTTYRGCRSIGRGTGFVLAGNGYDAGFSHTTRIINGEVDEFTRRGVYYSGTASAGESVIEVTNSSFKGNAESTLYMIGIENQNSVDIIVKGAQFRGLTSNAYNLRAGNHLLVDTFVDSGDEANPEHPIRLSSVSGNVVVKGMIHYGSNTPDAYVRYSGSSDVDFTPMGEFFCNGAPALPLVENTGSGVLSSKYLQQTFKNTGVAEKAFSDATLVIDIDEGLFFASGFGEFDSLDELNAALGGEGTQAASEADNYATGIKIPVTPITRDQEGTIELHVTKTDETGSNDGIIFMSLWDGNSFGSNGGVRIRDHQSEAGKTRLLISDSSGVETADLKTVATIADGSERKIVVPYKADSSGLTVGGAAFVDDVDCDLSTNVDYITIGGQSSFGGMEFNRLVVRPNRISDADAVEISG